MHRPCHMRPALLLLPRAAVALSSAVLGAQTAAPDPARNAFTLLAGLSQITLGGGNVEGTWATRHFSFEYSHGFGLRFEKGLLGTGPRSQHLALRMPWTTGFGVGYRVTPSLDLRVEAKWHRYELFYDDQSFQSLPIKSYTTTTLGLGAYYRYYPFAASRGSLRGLVVVPSLRYWPNAASTLAGNQFSYQNSRTGRTEVHTATHQGLPSAEGLVANVSVGYTL